MMGRNTARPWDGPAVQGQAKPLPADAKPVPTAEEIRAFVEWIDLGASWAAAKP
jgi:hypothetical protein